MSKLSQSQAPGYGGEPHTLTHTLITSTVHTHKLTMQHSQENAKDSVFKLCNVRKTYETLLPGKRPCREQFPEAPECFGKLSSLLQHNFQG